MYTYSLQFQHNVEMSSPSSSDEVTSSRLLPALSDIIEEPEDKSASMEPIRASLPIQNVVNRIFAMDGYLDDMEAYASFARALRLYDSVSKSKLAQKIAPWDMHWNDLVLLTHILNLPDPLNANVLAIMREIRPEDICHVKDGIKLARAIMTLSSVIDSVREETHRVVFEEARDMLVKFHRDENGANPSACDVRKGPSGGPGNNGVGGQNHPDSG